MNKRAYTGLVYKYCIPSPQAVVIGSLLEGLNSNMT